MMAIFLEKISNNHHTSRRNFLNFQGWRGAKECELDRSRQTLSKEYLLFTSILIYLQKSASTQPRTRYHILAKIGFDTAENGSVSRERDTAENHTRHSTFDIRHSTFDIRHSTFDIRHSTFDIRHSTFDIRHSTSPPNFAKS